MNPGEGSKKAMGTCVELGLVSSTTKGKQQELKINAQPIIKS
jgi:hypothetical protein